MQWVRRAINGGVSFLLPPVCAVCECRLQTLQPLGVCPLCWQRLPRLNPADEPALDEMLSHAAFGHYFAPFVYAQEVIPLIAQLKYYQAPQMALPLAQFMARAIPNLPDYDTVVPVPLDRRRLFSRGYNQAAELARLIAQAGGVAFDPLSLKRTKKAGRQVGRSRSARMRAVQGAFVADARIQGQSVLLVDDVLTTGSTAHACAKALLAAGAKRVDVVSAAWVRP